MTPPTWLDDAGRRVPTRRCWSCGAETPAMRFRAGDLRRHGWVPTQTLRIAEWCGHSQEYLPLLTRAGRWRLVPVWDPGDPPRNPLPRYEPADHPLGVPPEWAPDSRLPESLVRRVSGGGAAGPDPA